MSGAALDRLRVEALGPQRDRVCFESGAEPLDRYFHVHAGQDARKNIAAPFVQVLPDGTIGGYYNLSATAVKLAEFPAQTMRKLPRYPLVPATLLGRFAVDRRHQGGATGAFSWLTGCSGQHAARLRPLR